MRHLPAAPLDYATGMPPLVLPHSSNRPGVVDYHHPWFPKRHDELLADHPYVSELHPEELSLHELGGMAVRMSRGQILPVDVHVAFHRQYAGPALPTSLTDKFTLAVRGCAGVLPRWGLDVSAPAYRQRVGFNRYTHTELARMTRSVKPEYHYYNHYKEQRRALLGEYFVRYALLHGFTGAPERDVDEFLDTSDLERRRVLGNRLLMMALDASVQPLRQSYADQKRKKMTLPGAPPPLIAIKKHLAPHNLPKYHGYLRDRLIAA